MILGPFDGVGNHRAGFHDKGPVAGLGEEKFAGSLAQGAIEKRVRGGMAKATGELDHAHGGMMEVGIDPGVGAFEPNGPVAFVAPRRGGRGGDLMGIVAGEEFRRGDHGKSFLIMGGFAKEIVQKDGSLVPPVSVELGIVRAEDDRLGAHDPVEMFDLFFAIEHEVGGMFGGALASEVRSVGLLVSGASGDAVILEAGELSHAIGLDIRADVVVI